MNHSDIGVICSNLANELGHHPTYPFKAFLQQPRLSRLRLEHVHTWIATCASRLQGETEKNPHGISMDHSQRKCISIYIIIYSAIPSNKIETYFVTISFRILYVLSLFCVVLCRIWCVFFGWLVLITSNHSILGANWAQKRSSFKIWNIPAAFLGGMPMRVLLHSPMGDVPWFPQFHYIPIPGIPSIPPLLRVMISLTKVDAPRLPRFQDSWAVRLNVGIFPGRCFTAKLNKRWHDKSRDEVMDMGKDLLLIISGRFTNLWLWQIDLVEVMPCLMVSGISIIVGHGQLWSPSEFRVHWNPTMLECARVQTLEDLVPSGNLYHSYWTLP